MTKRRIPRLLVFALCGTVALAWFAWLRPTALGGDASYVIVRGTSMEPTYHDGDLVLARRAGSYAKGDVIVFQVGGAFNDPAMVIHRIVGGDGHRGHVTRGDNRDRTDPWQPRDASIIGKATFALPGFGRAADVVRSPWFLALLGAMVVFFDGARRRRHRRAVVRRRRGAEVAVAAARSVRIGADDHSPRPAAPDRASSATAMPSSDARSLRWSHRFGIFFVGAAVAWLDSRSRRRRGASGEHEPRARVLQVPRSLSRQGRR